MPFTAGLRAGLLLRVPRCATLARTGGDAVARVNGDAVTRVSGDVAARVDGDTITQAAAARTAVAGMASQAMRAVRVGCGMARFLSSCSLTRTYAPATRPRCLLPSPPKR